MNNYIVFSSYYKHGETSTEIYQSLLEMFDKFLYINICECLEQIILENIPDSESENESDDDSDNESVKIYDEDYENAKIEYNMLYNKYKNMYERQYRSIEKNKKQDYFKILTENIETNEEILLNDIIKMNHNLFTNNWSIRTIIKVKKNYYTSYI
jgi:hypothetical protein